MKDIKKVLIDSLLEGLRVVVLAIVPVVISGIESGNIDYRVISVAGAVAFLRFVDKLLHLYGKEVENQTLITGLTRF